MRIIKAASTLLSVCMIMFACNKKHDQPFLTVDRTNVTLAASGQTDSIIINSSVPWKFTVPASARYWLFFSDTSGPAGTKTIRFNAQASPLNSSRSVAITVTDITQQVAPVTFTVLQKYEVKVDGLTYEGPGGATINISGRGFSTIPAENNVSINGITATVQNCGNTFLTVVVPPMCDSGPLKVTVNSNSDISEFIYDWIGVITIVAGSTTGGYMDGTGTSAQFLGPDGIDLDAAGNLYVADYANYKIRKVTPAGAVTTLPGRIPAWNNPSGPNTDFGLPSDVAVDPAGNVYVTEFNSSVITKISTAGVVSVLAGSTTTYGNTDGVGSAALFYRPVGISIDATGNMFVAEAENHRIRKVTPGGAVTTVAGSTQGFADGTGYSAKFNQPLGIATDQNGNSYVADRYNNRIRKTTPAGVVTTFTGSDYGGPQNGPLSVAGFSGPHDIAIDGTGIMYIADGSNYVMRRITLNGRVSPVTGCIDSVTGNTVILNYVSGIAISPTGTIYVSEYNNNRIWRMNLK